MIFFVTPRTSRSHGAPSAYGTREYTGNPTRLTVPPAHTRSQRPRPICARVAHHPVVCGERTPHSAAGCAAGLGLGGWAGGAAPLPVSSSDEPSGRAAASPREPRDPERRAEAPLVRPEYWRLMTPSPEWRVV
eukprot:1393864-Prymnesium_polylepis.1